MTNLAHLQDLFRHFSTLLDVMFLPQGSTTLLNAFDGDEILPLEGSAARLLGCSTAQLPTLGSSRCWSRDHRHGNHQDLNALPWATMGNKIHFKRLQEMQTSTHVRVFL